MKRSDLGLVLQGLWFRRWVSLAVLVVASLVVGAAVTGPLFLRAAGESVLRDTLAASASSGRGVADAFSGRLGDAPLRQVQDDVRAKLAKRPTLARLLGPATASLQTVVTAGAPGVTPENLLMAWRDDVCDHLRMVEGACADQSGTVVASTTTAEAEGWAVGQTLAVSGRRLVLVGIYVPLDPSGDYWAGRSYFAAFSPLRRDPTSLDALFASEQTFEGSAADTSTDAAIDRQIDLTRLRVADVEALAAELDTWSDVDAVTAVQGDTAGPVVLRQADTVVKALTLPVLVVEAQLLVLCWLVLFLVVANAAEARGPEVALAKLRGVGVGATVAFGLLDTLLLVLLAVPVGFLMAWAWTVGLTRSQLAPGVPVVVTAAAGWAATGAGAGALVGAALATARTLRRPVVEQWRRASRRVQARSWLVDAAVAVVVVIGLVALLGPETAVAAPGAFALVAPSLVVLLAALVGSRVLPGLCRAAYGPTRRRGWVAGLLAVRQLGRRPSTLRLALLLTVAFGLVVFGVDAWSVARANAHDRAWTEVGAAEVLTVSVPPGTDLGAVVDRIDPGAAELAAVSTAADFTRTPSILLMGVQRDRFARVAFWRPDLGPAPLADLTGRLTSVDAPPVLLSGDRLRIDVDVPAMTADGAPLLVADVVQPSALGGATPVVLGPVGVGRRTLEAELPCLNKTCRLAGLELRRAGTTLGPFHGTIRLTGVHVHGAAGWQDLPGAVRTVAGWRPVRNGARSVESSSEGTVLDVDAALADTPAWQVADHPQTLPALVTEGVPAAARTSGAGLGSRRLPLDPVAVTVALPAGGDRGVVVDRELALRASEGSVARDIETVWVAPSGVAHASQQLEAAGVAVLDTSSATDVAQVYRRQGPQLALLLFLAGASLAALLAGGAAALTLHLSGRRRTYELAAMLALGLRRRTLLAALFLEQGVLVLFGVVVGTAAGLVAAALALPAIPEFSDLPSAPPLRYDIQSGPVALSVGLAVLVLALTVVVSSTSLVRSSHVDQLREAPA